MPGCPYSDTRKQVYISLSAMEKWAIQDDNTGINLSALYDLFREQFCDPDDPWYTETLEWWNEYVFPPIHMDSGHS